MRLSRVGGARRTLRRGLGVAAATGMAATLVGGALPAQAAVAGTTGELQMNAAPPSLQENAFESNDVMRAINEKQDVVLSKSACLDFTGTGKVTWETTEPASVPAGTVVDSHILHADPVGNPGGPGSIRYTGSVTFDSDIIGIAILDASLDCTDFLGAQGTIYPTGLKSRGLEQGDIVIADNARTLTVNVILHRLDQIRVITKGAKPVAGAEGCTPGYWKQPQHFDSWTGFSTGTSFESVFGEAFPGNPTLLQVLGMGGGGKAALGRHAVAALLNSTSDGVDYAFTTDEVIAMVTSALANPATIEATKNKLATANEKGCRLN